MRVALRLPLALAIAIAAGCSADHSDLAAYIQTVEARSAGAGRIAPLPEIPSAPAPPAELTRDPFQRAAPGNT